MTVKAPVAVRCSVCGCDYDLSASRVREHRRRGTSPRCPTCRHPARPPDPRRLEALRQWWLDRYTLAELKSWPPLT